MSYDINICTVSTFEAVHVKINKNLAESLNPGKNIKWIITENIAENQKPIDYLDNSDLLLQGTHVNDIGSIALQHSIAINKTLNYVNSRFVVIIDPDFYIIKDNWIDDVIKHMKKNKLAMLGVPWHPKWYFKYRFFPCSHCLFIDTKKIDLSEIDFRPTSIVWDNPEKVFSTPKSSSKRKIPFYSQIKKIKNTIQFYTYGRKKIGFDGDTTSRIYLKYKNISEIECAMPVLYPDRDWLLPINYKINKFVENFLPERLSYLHSKNILWRDKGFLKNNYLQFGWEEFYLNNEPFGFHVRGWPKTKWGIRDYNKESITINNVLTELIQNNKDLI